MCFVLLLLILAFYTVPILGAWSMARERQRSGFWTLWAAVPVLGFATTAILGYLPPLGHCAKCGRRLRNGVLSCPDCGGRPVEAPALRPLRGNEINPGLGLTIIGAGALVIGTLAFLIVGRYFWNTGDRWDCRSVQARLMDDPQVVQLLGSPLRFGWPTLDEHERNQTFWGTVQFTVVGPKGQADVDCGFVTCRQHGWHFRRLEVTPSSGAQPLHLSDLHVGPYQSFLGSVYIPPSDQSREQMWPAVVLGRLTRDPGLLGVLGGPLRFPSKPDLRSEGPGRWHFQVEVQGRKEAGTVRGILEENAQAFAFPRIELSLQGEEATRELHQGPGVPPLVPPFREALFRIESFVVPSLKEGFRVAAGIGLVLLLIVSAAWLASRRKGAPR